MNEELGYKLLHTIFKSANMLLLALDGSSINIGTCDIQILKNHISWSGARVTIDVAECSTSQWTRPTPRARF